MFSGAFELWCWRRILRTPWTARQTNSWVIGMINSKWTLESRVAKAMMSYFGHVSRAEGGMEKEVMMGQMEGKRGRGRPRRRRLDGIKEMTKEGGGGGGGTMRETENRSRWK